MAAEERADTKLSRRSTAPRGLALTQARKKIHPGQAPFVDRLLNYLGDDRQR